MAKITDLKQFEGHTPGPWEAVFHQSGNLINAKVDIGKENMSDGVLQPLYNITISPRLRVLSDGTVEAILAYEDYRQFPSQNFVEMQEANTKLIAAAPDLLETLAEREREIAEMKSMPCPFCGESLKRDELLMSIVRTIVKMSDSDLQPLIPKIWAVIKAEEPADE